MLMLKVGVTCNKSVISSQRLNDHADNLNELMCHPSTTSVTRLFPVYCSLIWLIGFMVTTAAIVGARGEARPIYHGRI